MLILAHGCESLSTMSLEVLEHHNRETTELCTLRSPFRYSTKPRVPRVTKGRSYESFHYFASLEGRLTLKYTTGYVCSRFSRYDKYLKEGTAWDPKLRT